MATKHREIIVDGVRDIGIPLKSTKMYENIFFIYPCSKYNEYCKDKKRSIERLNCSFFVTCIQNNMKGFELWNLFT